METTQTAIEYILNYETADLDIVTNVVANNFFLIVVIILSTYPFLYILHALISYAQKAFDLDVITKLEGGGIWSRFPDGSIYNGLEKIANIKFGEKWTKRR